VRSHYDAGRDSQTDARMDEEPHMTTPMAIKQQDDPDIHKGALEGDRPEDEQQGNPHGDGVDEDGLPDDPIASAEDAEGANADKSQG
jgi:hypothetical protein